MAKKQEKIKKIALTISYQIIAYISLAFFGFASGLLTTPNPESYTTTKLLILGFFALTSLIIAGISSIMLTKKFQESLEEYHHDKMNE